LPADELNALLGGWEGRAVVSATRFVAGTERPTAEVWVQLGRTRRSFVCGGCAGIGRGHVGKGLIITVLVDARSLPATSDTAPADQHESRCAPPPFDFMPPRETPPHVVGGYAHDKLDANLAGRGVELLAPHCGSREPENFTQGRRPLQRAARRRTLGRTVLWIQTTEDGASAGRSRAACSAVPAYDLHVLVAFRNSEIGSGMLAVRARRIALSSDEHSPVARGPRVLG
jgi:hypothetical protein